MRSTCDPAAERLAATLSAVTAQEFSSDEQRWIRAIEKLRAGFASTQESVSFVDYGAGSPGDRMSSEEMARGRAQSRSLAELAMRTSKKSPWTHLLLKLVRNFRPKRCLEFGTCVGISTAYQAAGLRLNGQGILVTMEGAAALADRARQNLAALQLEGVHFEVGRFADILEDVLNSYGPFDFVFIDGHHDGQATRQYFDHILPKLTPGAVVIFDDILWYKSMAQAWRDIRSRREVRLSVDHGAMGICVVDRGATNQWAFSYPLNS